MRIEPEEIGGNDIAQNRSEHMADQEHARAGAHFALGQKLAGMNQSITRSAVSMKDMDRPAVCEARLNLAGYYPA